ncbi:MrcB family domain-containing protein [Streptomyces sp. ISL-11]|uniref:MrcB family domain-containing protein n=1 Tax=Streptomyces sp. ISL-11 TaxID=2819174 RepID=UPI001BEC0546|nr:DUF3578 domain-containing protein [Streptomyces sp. ISL-11]MBT2384243.1 DUF3578 domain-containing protein [Streptomyces sp. ISL-11]
MGIRDLLSEVAATYDKGAGTQGSVPGQKLLRDAKAYLASAVPPGYVAEGHGGNGGATETPWIGVFDPHLNRDPKTGLYLAYIFAADLETVTLTLQQGVTGLPPHLGEGKRRRDYLEPRAQALLTALPGELVAGWDVRPALKSQLSGPLSYQAGSVVARCYDLAAMPSEGSLREDLWHMAEAFQQAAAAFEKLSIKEAPSGLAVSYVARVHGKPSLEGFRPKDSSDYVAHIPERTIKKTRDHEDLINRFVTYIRQRGFAAATEHPKDLVLRKGDHEWLVEAKTIKHGNPTSAVRQAVGQLFEYSHFLCEDNAPAKPHLVGLFTEDIKGYTPYLESLGIVSVWMTPGGWEGSPSAVSSGLVD